MVATDDVRIMVYTADPGTDDAERLALAVVLGTQPLVDQPSGPAPSAPSVDRPGYEA